MYFIFISVLPITHKYEKHTPQLLESSKLNFYLPSKNFCRPHQATLLVATLRDQGTEIFSYSIFNFFNHIVKQRKVSKFVSNRRALGSLPI